MTDAPILVTGVAGFIGYHTGRRLLDAGRQIVGLDIVNSYYDPVLKEARLAELAQYPGFRFLRIDIADRDAMAAVFAQYKFKQVVHLAAQAGVRYSLVEPGAYVASNITGFLHILEGCRASGCEHLVYASSSSVYGSNTTMPFSTAHNVDHPLNIYGATKKANELMAHSYSHLFGLPTSGLRFFTVYGPWGRPDMAIWLFTEAMLAGKPIKLFNHGNMRRDFTYVDDVVEATVRLIDHPPSGDPSFSTAAPDPGTSSVPWRVYNIGNRNPVEIGEVVRLIEKAVGKTAVRENMPMQPGDVLATYADVSALEQKIGFSPSTPIARGIENFVAWYLRFHNKQY